MTDVFFAIFIFFTIFVLCSMCGFCCKKKDEGAIFSTPIVVTSTTHQAPGTNYAVQTHPTTAPLVAPYPTQQQQNMPMPMAFPNAPYPQTNAAAPYPPMNTSAPYPPTTYQPGAAPAGYPPAQAPQNMYPPSYEAAMNASAPPNADYQKQSPYNPSFGGN